KYKIADLVKIQSGIHPNLLTLGPGTYFKYIQIRDFDENISLNYRKPKLIKLKDYKENIVLKENDILVAARGDRFFAYLYKKSEDEYFSIASSSFFILRIFDEQLIIPEYLTAFLNSKSIQRKIKEYSRGTHIKAITREPLSMLKIDVPPISEQESIVKKLNILYKYKNLILKKAELENQLYESLIHQ